METFIIEHEIKAFGKQVKNFHLDIPGTFGSLVKMIPDGYKRAFYGISYMTETGEIIYYAAAEETYEGEAEKYNCERYLIEKGEYLKVVVKDWRTKTDCIKDVFHEMMQDGRFDKNKPCIEWYKSDDEMWCMLKTLSSHL